MGTPAHDFVKFFFKFKMRSKEVYDPCLRALEVVKQATLTVALPCGSLKPGQGTTGALRDAISCFVFMKPNND